ncbi:MAG: hypothetical protein AAF138_02415 [Planctomycetota bacterium]
MSAAAHHNQAHAEGPDPASALRAKPDAERPRFIGPAETAAVKSYCGVCAFSSAAKPLIKIEPQVESLFDTLLDRGHYFDAIRLAARCMHPWRALEWAREGVAELLPPEEGSPDEERFAAIDTWIEKPSEAERRKLMDRAREEEFESPACWVMASAGWTYGSIAPEHIGVAVPPPDGLAGKAAATALILAAQQDAAERKAKTADPAALRLLERGLEYAQMESPDPWPPIDEDAPEEEEALTPLDTLATPVGEAVVRPSTAPQPVERPQRPEIPRPKPSQGDAGWAPEAL